MAWLKSLKKAYLEAIKDTQYVYQISEIQICDPIEDSTIRYQLIGTGKTSQAVSLFELYNDEETLARFRPLDIKTISVTIAWLRNPPPVYQINAIEHNTRGQLMVRLQNKKTGKSQSVNINELKQDLPILAQTDRKSVFRLGFLQGLSVGERNKKLG